MHLDRTIKRGLGPPALHAMHMVQPVPRGVAADIAARFFPEHHRGSEPPPFLARLYIGAEPRRARAAGMPAKIIFSPLNFHLSACMMEELSLPVAEVAKAMGRTLAMINFMTGADGRDIEFVLGGDPDDPLRKAGYACIDFNQLRQHCGDPGVIADAWSQNDPYYPRPSSAYWAHFESGYLETAERASQCPLASRVIDCILERLSVLPLLTATSALGILGTWVSNVCLHISIWQCHLWGRCNFTQKIIYILEVAGVQVGRQPSTYACCLNIPHQRTCKNIALRTWFGISSALQQGSFLACKEACVASNKGLCSAFVCTRNPPSPAVNVHFVFVTRYIPCKEHDDRSSAWSVHADQCVYLSERQKCLFRTVRPRQPSIKPLSQATLWGVVFI